VVMMLPPLSSIMRPQAVKLGSSAEAIPDILDEIAGLLSRAAGGVGQGKVYEALLAREAVQSTALGYGSAVPHAQVPGLAEPSACVIVSEGGVPFGALDGKPVRIFFGLAIPDFMTAERAGLVNEAFRLLMNEDFRHRTLEATNGEEVLNAVKELEGR
jgi:mannitol/fructose-specific phosphotransferase system IIA component (Ntr-type)